MAKQHRTGEKDRSVPAGSDPKGTPVPAQPKSDEQSGSTGRRTDKDDLGQGKDSGQGRYGQTGFGDAKDRETMGQKRYRKSGPDGGQDADPDSNKGSGRPDVDSPKR